MNTAEFEYECDHDETEIVNAKPATCDEDGYTGDKVCAECGEVFEKGTSIAAKGHVDSDEDGKCDFCADQLGTPGDVEEPGASDDETVSPAYALVVLAALACVAVAVKAKKFN